MNPQNNSFHDFVVEQLERLPDFHSRSMFGGFGLYSEGLFFGIIYQSRLYFRTGNDTRHAYTAAGMKFFQPNPKQSLKNYYEVPADIIDDIDSLIGWAEGAIKNSAVT